MKKLISLFLLIFPLLTYAAEKNSDLNLESIRLNELAKLGYTQILGLDFIADNSFNNDAQTASIYLKGKTNAQIKSSINSLILSAGYDVSEISGVVKIVKHKELEFELSPFYYSPKYREVGYLTDMVSNIFKVGTFTFNRAVKNQYSKNTDIPDSGNSAFSQLQKPVDAFLFNGTKKEIDQLTQLLDVLDKPQKEVNVKAYIYEVSNTEGKAQSLNLTVDLLNSKLGANLAADVLSSFISIKTFGITAIFSALNSDSRFKVISSPSLRVKDRETAKFSVGAEVPVLGAVVTQNGTSTQSVEYKQSGVIVEVSPKIRENVIELTINQELSNFIQTNTGVNNSPTLIKRGLSTVVTAQDDEVIILGGLDEQKTTSGSSGFPLLPSILRNKSLDSSKNNILLVLHVQKI